jgi:pyrroloquinoline quinone (PQQ) biosynthesis protein C
MVERSQVEELLSRHLSELTEFAGFEALVSGQGSREDYEGFLVNLVRTHLRSPQVLAFLYSLAPPEAAANLAHNMLEELGIEEESGIAHPSLLRELAKGAGLGDRLAELEVAAQESLRQIISEPILYGTLKEVGLATLVEVVAFEFMLSRVASRIARALARHLRLSSSTLEWFTHHSEVDIRHAEQGIDNVLSYVRYYGFSDEDALTICGMALRENVFIKRYFGEKALARTGGAGA